MNIWDDQSNDPAILVTKLETYGFQSEAGPLHLCTDWRALRTVVLDRAPAIAAHPTADQQAAGSVEAALRAYVAFAKLRRDELGELSDEMEAVDAQARAALDSRAQPAPRPTDDDLWDQTLRERDLYHDWADRLAEAIAKHFGVDIGEHSNQNCPWAEALEAIESAQPVAAGELTAQERYAIEEAANQLDGAFLAPVTAGVLHKLTKRLDAFPMTVAAGELPPLPKAEHSYQASSDSEFASNWKSAYTADQMRAYGQQCADSRPAGGATAGADEKARNQWHFLIASAWREGQDQKGDLTTEQRFEFSKVYADSTRPDWPAATLAASVAQPAPAAAVRATERIDAMHKGVVGALAAIKAEHAVSVAQPGAMTDAEILAIRKRVCAEVTNYGEIRGLGLRFARAVLEAAGASPVVAAVSPIGVPDGWKTVPLVPTDAMCIAVREKIGTGSNIADHIYRTMLAAAPAAPTTGEG